MKHENLKGGEYSTGIRKTNKVSNKDQVVGFKDFLCSPRKLGKMNPF